MRDNILSASVPISLDGRELVLRYRAYAFIRYSEATGGDLLHDLRQFAFDRKPDGEESGEQAAALSKPLPWAKLRDIVWAGLIDAQPEITRDEVARMFGISELRAIVPAIVEALQKTAPEASKNGRPTRVATRRGSMRTDGLASGPDSGTDAELPPASSSV